MLAVFICVIILVTAVTSYLVYLILKRLGAYNRTIVLIIAALNVLFCAAFPLLFALLGGNTNAIDGTPSLGMPVVFVILFILTLLYIALVVWRIVLRSPVFLLDVPIPEPEPTEMRADVLQAQDIDAVGQNAFDTNMDITSIMADITQNYTEETKVINGYEKDTVDTVINIDKMSIITELHHDPDENDINSLVNRAFDSLNGGRLDEAAEYFYGAIEKHPPLNLEIQIAIQLCMVYLDLGQADLAFDILVGYNDQYRNRLSDEDKSILETGISMIESMVTGIGGDGHEKN